MGLRARPYGHIIRMVDMPAHIKSVLIGPSLSLPISNGRLALGTWQGIYLCEHRDNAGTRRLVATIQGE
ncbi:MULTISPECIES: YjbQ family protein [unclassified Alcanivorax]|uniref:YjbQ family protein n=1 Tax=unclassified Alcanivorax TaxID=2638842 RepID=UPI0009DEFD3F|nr:MULTISPECIES: YjbQ family protein [unclassified Alcanivorax]